MRERKKLADGGRERGKRKEGGREWERAGLRERKESSNEHFMKEGRSGKGSNKVYVTYFCHFHGL